MAFLGEPLPAKGPPANGPGRCTKDLLEERLFDRRRDLFTEVELVFFDTTSLYFEGEGGESLGGVSYFTNPGGTFEKSGPSPSAIVGWASTASRSFQ
jgi:hypothetical protein